MTVLVTGAGGFLGSELVRQLHVDGSRVRVVVRNATAGARLASAGCEVVNADLNDVRAMREACRGVQGIYHCAGCVTDWAPRAQFWRDNVGSLEALLAAANGSVAARVVHISTTDVYGYPARAAGVAEHSPLRPVGEPYADSKIAAEQVLERWRGKSSFDVIVLRPASIYGEGSQTLVDRPLQALRLPLTPLFGKAEVTAGLIHVQDVARAARLAMSSSNRGWDAFNVVNEEPVTWRNYFEGLAKLAGLRPRFARISETVGLALARMFEEACRRTGGEPLLTKTSVLLLSRPQGFPGARASDRLGFSAEVSFHEGLERLAATMRPPSVSAGRAWRTPPGAA